MTRKKNWRSKNLYLTFRNQDTRILGIKPLIDSESDSESDSNNAVQSAEVVCDWDNTNTNTDGVIYPVGMAVFEKDSKIYAIGGQIRSPNSNNNSSEDNYSKAFVSDVVYEFSNPNSPSCLVKPSVHVPRLPLPMPRPIVAKIKGEIYVLYGDSPFDNVRCVVDDANQHDMHNCFLVLHKDEFRNGHKWRPLPPPPFFVPQKWGRHKWYFGDPLCGVVGGKLLVRTTDQVFAFDVETNRWDEVTRSYNRHEDCVITLSISISSSGYFVVVKPSYENEYDTVDGIRAELVDGAGNVVRTQSISDAMHDRFSTECFKMVELDEEEAEEEVRSSAVFMACFFRNETVAISVVRVSLITPETSGDFLEVEVLEKRRYVIRDSDRKFDHDSIDNVFLC